MGNLIAKFYIEKQMRPLSSGRICFLIIISNDCSAIVSLTTAGNFSIMIEVIVNAQIIEYLLEILFRNQVIEMAERMLDGDGASKLAVGKNVTYDLGEDLQPMLRCFRVFFAKFNSPCKEIFQIHGKTSLFWISIIIT